MSTRRLKQPPKQAKHAPEASLSRRGGSLESLQTWYVSLTPTLQALPHIMCASPACSALSHAAPLAAQASNAAHASPPLTGSPLPLPSRVIFLSLSPLPHVLFLPSSSLTHPLFHSLTYSLFHTLPLSLSHRHSPFPSLAHSLFPSLTHSLLPSLAYSLSLTFLLYSFRHQPAAPYHACHPLGQARRRPLHHLPLRHPHASVLWPSRLPRCGASGQRRGLATFAEMNCALCLVAALAACVCCCWRAEQACLRRAPVGAGLCCAAVCSRLGACMHLGLTLTLTP